MVASIVPFLFENEHTVREGIGENGEALFVGVDICRLLGIKQHEKALARLPFDERGTLTIGTPGGDQTVIGVTEPGFYHLIFTSRVEKAERVKRWLAHEVMPAIRKTGSYQPVLGQGGIPGGTPLLTDSEPLNSSLPFHQWSNETVNTRLRLVGRSERLFGVVASAHLWEQLGFPMPAPHLGRQRRQFELWNTIIDAPAQ